MEMQMQTYLYMFGGGKQNRASPSLIAHHQVSKDAASADS